MFFSYHQRDKNDVEPLGVIAKGSPTLLFIDNNKGGQLSNGNDREVQDDDDMDDVGVAEEEEGSGTDKTTLESTNSNATNTPSSHPPASPSLASEASKDSFIGIQEQYGIPVAAAFLLGFAYVGTYGGLGSQRATTFSEWGGVSALYAAVSTFIAGVMSYSMLQKAVVLAATNRTEDREVATTNRKEEKEVATTNRREDKEEAAILLEMAHKREDAIRMEGKLEAAILLEVAHNREDAIRKEDREEAAMREAKMRKMDRLERKEERLEDAIAGLHSRRLSAWPNQWHAIDQDMSF